MNLCMYASMCVWILSKEPWSWALFLNAARRPPMLMRFANSYYWNGWIATIFESNKGTTTRFQNVMRFQKVSRVQRLVFCSSFPGPELNSRASSFMLVCMSVCVHACMYISMDLMYVWHICCIRTAGIYTCLCTLFCIRVPAMHAYSQTKRQKPSSLV